MQTSEKLTATQRWARRFKSEFTRNLEAGNTAACLEQAEEWKRMIDAGNRVMSPAASTLIRHLIAAMTALHGTKGSGLCGLPRQAALPQETLMTSSPITNIGIDMGSPDGDYTTVAVRNGKEITTFREGDLVSYWRGRREGMFDGQGVIKSFGQIGGSTVAWIEGCRGGISVTHLALVKA